MAEKAVQNARAGFAFLSTWSGLSKDDVGQPADVAGAVERSVQVDGEFNASLVYIEGSNDGVAYHTLTTIDGLSADLTRPGLRGIREITRFLRPRVQGGHPETKLTVTLIVRIR